MLELGEHYFFRHEDYLDEIEFVPLWISQTEMTNVVILPSILNETFEFGTTSNWETSSTREFLNGNFLNRLHFGSCLHRDAGYGDTIRLLNKTECYGYQRYIAPICCNRYSWTMEAKDERNVYVIGSHGVADGCQESTHRFYIMPVCHLTLFGCEIFKERDRNIVLYNQDNALLQMIDNIRGTMLNSIGVPKGF